MQAVAATSPWRTDRPWNPTGGPGDLERRGRRALLWGAAALAVVLPWNGLAAGRPDLVPLAAVAIADAVPALLLLRGTWLHLAWRRQGAARLGFDRFPFFLGEPFEAVLRLGPEAGEGAVEVSLSCHETRLLEGGAGLAWREVEVYRATQVVLVAPETEIVFELPSPERDLGTSLGTREARRWELTVRGRAGARVKGSFPVPVYPPPPDGVVEDA